MVSFKFSNFGSSFQRLGRSLGGRQRDSFVIPSSSVAVSHTAASACAYRQPRIQQQLANWRVDISFAALPFSESALHVSISSELWRRHCNIIKSYQPRPTTITDIFFMISSDHTPVFQRQTCGYTCDNAQRISYSSQHSVSPSPATSACACIQFHR